MWTEEDKRVNPPHQEAQLDRQEFATYLRSMLHEREPQFVKPFIQFFGQNITEIGSGIKIEPLSSGGFKAYLPKAPKELSQCSNCASEPGMPDTTVHDFFKNVVVPKILAPLDKVAYERLKSELLSNGTDSKTDSHKFSKIDDASRMISFSQDFSGHRVFVGPVASGSPGIGRAEVIALFDKGNLKITLVPENKSFAPKEYDVRLIDFINKSGDFCTSSFGFETPGMMKIVEICALRMIRGGRIGKTLPEIMPSSFISQTQSGSNDE
jgi:hypothetical protein